MPRDRVTTRLHPACLLALLFVASSAQALTVNNLQAMFRDGQTFLTWDQLPGDGWVYHVYRSYSPLFEQSSLDDALELAQVGDHTAVDERLSSLLGETVTYRIAEDQPPLAPTRGLFVQTTAENGLFYYAVTAQRVGLSEDRRLIAGRNFTGDAVWERIQRPKPVWQRTLERPRGEDYVLWTSNLSTPEFPAMANVPGRAYHVGVIRGAPGGALVLHGHGRGGSFFNSLIGTGVPGEWVLSIDDHLT